MFSLSLTGLISAQQLPDEDNRPIRVALIGSTLIDRMQEHGAFEAMALKTSSERQLIIRTLAWPADEITIRPRPDAYGDLFDALKREQPDIILAQYGFNESFQGLDRLQKFQREYREFLTQLKQVPTLSAENFGCHPDRLRKKGRTVERD